MSALIISDYVNIVGFWLGIELLNHDDTIFHIPVLASLQHSSRFGWNDEIKVDVLKSTTFLV